MKKELGGERLNNGKKMEVELPNYDTSNQDLGFIVRTTMSAGTIVPLFLKLATPGDFWKIRAQMVIRTHPTVGPLFGSYKAEIQFFKFALRLYQGELYTDATEQGLDMAAVKLPQFLLNAKPAGGASDINNAQINPSCLLKYLGISGIGMVPTATDRSFHASSLLGYWDTIKNYFANKQERIGAVIHTPSETLVNTVTGIFCGPYGGSVVEIETDPSVGSTPIQTGYVLQITYVGAVPLMHQIYINLLESGPYTIEQIGTVYSVTATDVYVTVQNTFGANAAVNWKYVSNINPVQRAPKVVTFDLTQIDQMRRNILALTASPGQQFIVSDQDLEPYKWLFEESGGVPNILCSQEGLAVKTYMSDLLNNWLNTEWISGAGGINEVSAITVESGTFQIPQFLLKKKIYDMLNNVAVTGGSIEDWQEANWNKKPKPKATKPEYEGGLIKEIVFQEVVSNSASDTNNTDQPLGTLAGKGVMGDKHVGGYIECDVDEISYIMGLAMITPRIDYSQGNEWDIHLQSIDDVHKPAMDGIGFQDLLQERAAWWSTQWDGTKWVQKSFGKQPAWMDYRTSINKTFGNFAIEDNEMFMTLNRRYERDSTTGGIKDATTYIDPVKFNHIFAQTSIDAQNFWVQAAFDVEVRRKLSNRLMPVL